MSQLTEFMISPSRSLRKKVSHNSIFLPVSDQAWSCAVSSQNTSSKDLPVKPMSTGIRSWRAHQAVTACKSAGVSIPRSEEHTSELQSRGHLVCRLLLEKKKED